jgi:hypothetical protein
MKVLVACEFSGIVRDAFRNKGHDAWSCDLLSTESDSQYHIEGDVRPLLDRRWDLMIAHPPCTYLANSGVRWLKDNSPRWESMREAAQLFRLLLWSVVPRVAVENPIMHKHGVERIGKRQDQTTQPWHFGNPQSKAICLWLKGLPLLKPVYTEKPENIEQKCWRMPPGPERQKERSRFFPEVAEAMAEQWGSL